MHIYFKPYGSALYAFFCVLVENTYNVNSLARLCLAGIEACSCKTCKIDLHFFAQQKTCKCSCKITLATCAISKILQYLATTCKFLDGLACLFCMGWRYYYSCVDAVHMIKLFVKEQLLLLKEQCCVAA